MSFYSDCYEHDKEWERQIQDCDKVRCRECEKFIGYGRNVGPLCFECKMEEEDTNEA